MYTELKINTTIKPIDPSLQSESEIYYFSVNLKKCCDQSHRLIENIRTKNYRETYRGIHVYEALEDSFCPKIYSTLNAKSHYYPNSKKNLV